MQSIAFFGLGVMGGGMARRLRVAGFPLTVWNRGAERAAVFQDEGFEVAPSPRKAAANVDVMITMLADDAASREVWLGADGALSAARPGSIAIECGTVSPDWIRELSIAASRLGCRVLDAPVTGSRPQAATGELLFLVGGDEAALESVAPVFAAMARGVVHLGPSGSGARMKLVNNFMCGVQAAALAEAIVMIERSGLDRDAAVSVLSVGAPGSPLVKAVGERMSARDYAVNFALRLMRKDLAYAVAEGARHGVQLRTAEAAGLLFERAVNDGHGGEDFSAVVEVLRAADGATS